MDYRNQPNLPRGIRNNNPGNLQYGPGWLGVVGEDSPFAIFSDSIYGLRALATDLGTKLTTDNLTTITEIISVYAPPSQNNTPAYISAVAGDTGLDPNATISLDTNTLASLVRAIVNHEEGDSASQQYVSDADIAQGISIMSIPLLNAFATGSPPPSPDPAGTALIIIIGVIALSSFLNQ